MCVSGTKASIIEFSPLFNHVSAMHRISIFSSVTRSRSIQHFFLTDCAFNRENFSELIARVHLFNFFLQNNQFFGAILIFHVTNKDNRWNKNSGHLVHSVCFSDSSHI